MRIKVTHTIDELRSDLTRIPGIAARDTRAAVRHGAMTGNLIAKDHARAKSGPHGKNFAKRFRWDTPVRSLFGGAGWSAEYGPVGVPKSEFVGAGYEHGDGNTDLEVSQGPAIGLVAQDIRRSMDGWFWPGRG